jgi:hypothetical protein
VDLNRDKVTEIKFDMFEWLVLRNQDFFFYSHKLPNIMYKQNSIRINISTTSKGCGYIDKWQVEQKWNECTTNYAGKEN